MANAAELEQFLDDPRFSRSFELPADASRGRDKPLTVTYADYGYRNEAQPEQEHVIFFFGGMFASRWLQVTKDKVAKQHRVRIISADRPGFGGTDAVSMESRLSVCRDMVTALLQHLRIPAVSFACHSAGTLVCLDTLLHHPELLDSRSPYIAIAGPWVHPSHSGVKTLAMAETLPRGLVNQFDKVVSFVHNHVEPWTTTSFGVSDPLVNLLSKPSSDGMKDEHVRFEDVVVPKWVDRAHKENTQGISSEALILLRRVKGMDGWEDWGDYDELIRRVAKVFGEAGRKLKVDVFYAENDAMIGAQTGKGPQWFDECWGSAGDAVEYSRSVVDGADHDGLWQLRWGLPQRVFEKVGSANSTSS